MHAIEQPTSRLLYRVAGLIVFSLVWFALAIVGVVLAVVFHWAPLVTFAFPTAIFTQLLAVVVALRFRCPSCHHRIFVQGFRTLHPARKRLPAGIASWIAVAWDILCYHQFICMHCGERCAVEV